ncbi:MAG: hypothetical protein ACE5GQ_06535 [Nitrospinales bacterium]
MKKTFQNTFIFCAFLFAGVSSVYAQELEADNLSKAQLKASLEILLKQLKEDADRLNREMREIMAELTLIGQETQKDFRRELKAIRERAKKLWREIEETLIVERKLVVAKNGHFPAKLKQIESELGNLKSQLYEVLKIAKQDWKTEAGAQKTAMNEAKKASTPIKTNYAEKFKSTYRDILKSLSQSSPGAAQSPNESAESTGSRNE